LITFTFQYTSAVLSNLKQIPQILEYNLLNTLNLRLMQSNKQSVSIPIPT